VRARRATAAIVVGLLGATAAAEPAAGASGLASPKKKEIAMRLVSSAENSSLNWRAQYRYIEDIHDGRGYTAGIIGFCSGTGDMLEVVQAYTRARHRNPLAHFLPALRRVNGSASHAGLGRRFVAAWRRAARSGAFRRAQNSPCRCAGPSTETGTRSRADHRRERAADQLDRVEVGV
jgi:chitosanase